MLRTFSQNLTNQSEIILDEDESWHISSVLRAKNGTEIEVLSGNGVIANGIIIAPDKTATRIKVTKISQIAPPNTKIILLHAALINKNTDFVVREATAIGVQNIWIFQSDRSEFKMKDKLESKLNHWKKLSIEACKQSGNPYLPDLNFASKLSDVQLPSEESLRLFGHIDANSQPLLNCLKIVKNIIIAIGPEGDFSEKEKQYLLENEFIGCSFGKNILRAETGTIYALGVVNSYIEAKYAK